MKLECPTCHKQMDVADDYPSRPFCSDRCKMADLGKWLDGDYVLSRPMTVEEALELPTDDA